jgi:hypothetical protein
MASYEAKVPTLPAAEAITQYQRIKLNTASQWAVAGAGAGGKAEGVASKTVAQGEQLASIPLIPGTVVPMIASEALTAGELVYGAAAGKIDDLTTNCLEGKVVKAASGDNSVVEVLIMPVSAVTL